MTKKSIGRNVCFMG